MEARIRRAEKTVQSDGSPLNPFWIKSRNRKSRLKIALTTPEKRLVAPDRIGVGFIVRPRFLCANTVRPKHGYTSPCRRRKKAQQFKPCCRLCSNVFSASSAINRVSCHLRGANCSKANNSMWRKLYGWDAHRKS